MLIILICEIYDQIDLTSDISGFLSAHPQAPLLSLHHFDNVDPIFPSMDRFESAKHLMKAAELDQSRMLQQTICYDRKTDWSFSISWGYSTQIYEKIIPRSILRTPIETFKPWVYRNDPPHYLFNTRSVSDPCETPHVFFMDKVEKKFYGDEMITSYVRGTKGGTLAADCSLTRKYSADKVSKVQVFSPATNPIQVRDYIFLYVYTHISYNYLLIYSSTCLPILLFSNRLFN